MDFVYIGKIVGTHGIKGEIRLISNFDKKEKVFIPNMNIYIGDKKIKETINSYRKHKNFDMITLKGIYNINDVLKYKQEKVFVCRTDLHLDNEYILDDLLNMRVLCDNKEYGIVKDIFDNNGNTLLEINFTKNYYIPFNKEYIKEVNLDNNYILVENVKELIL